MGPLSPPEAGSGSAIAPEGRWDRYRPQRLGVGALSPPEAGGTAIVPRGWEWKRYRPRRRVGSLSPPEAGRGSAIAPVGGWDRYRPQRLGMGALPPLEAGGSAIALPEAGRVLAPGAHLERWSRFRRSDLLQQRLHLLALPATGRRHRRHEAVDSGQRT